MSGAVSGADGHSLNCPHRPGLIKTFDVETQWLHGMGIGDLYDENYTFILTKPSLPPPSRVLLQSALSFDFIKKTFLTNLMHSDSELTARANKVSPKYPINPCVHKYPPHHSNTAAQQHKKLYLGKDNPRLSSKD